MFLHLEKYVSNLFNELGFFSFRLSPLVPSDFKVNKFGQIIFI